MSRLGLFSSALASGMGLAAPAALHLPLTVEDAVLAPRSASKSALAVPSAAAPGNAGERLAGSKRAADTIGGHSKEAVSKFSKRLASAIRHALYRYYTATLERAGGTGLLEVPPETVGGVSAPAAAGTKRAKATVVAPVSALLSTAEEFKAVVKKIYTKLLAKYMAEAASGGKKKRKGGDGAAQKSARLHFSRTKHVPAVETWVRQYMSERAVAKGSSVDWSTARVLGGAVVAKPAPAPAPAPLIAAVVQTAKDGAEDDDDDGRSSVSSLAMSEEEGSDHASIFGGSSDDESGGEGEAE